MNTQQPAPSINVAILLKHMAVGLVIGLFFISIFVFGVNNAPTEWGPNWQVRPLVVTPLVVAFGGACFYMADILFPLTGGLKIALNVVKVIGFAVTLWAGMILGLVGTMWD